MTRYRSERARQSYRRVLLAVYWLGDEFGATCRATIEEIAAEACLSVATTKKYLRDLERDEVFASFRMPARWKQRQRIAILDHPDAEHYLGMFAYMFSGRLIRRSERISRLTDVVVADMARSERENAEAERRERSEVK